MRKRVIDALRLQQQLLQKWHNVNRELHGSNTTGSDLARPSQSASEGRGARPAGSACPKPWSALGDSLLESGGHVSASRSVPSAKACDDGRTSTNFGIVRRYSRRLWVCSDYSDDRTHPTRSDICDFHGRPLPTKILERQLAAGHDYDLLILRHTGCPRISSRRSSMPLPAIVRISAESSASRSATCTRCLATALWLGLVESLKRPGGMPHGKPWPQWSGLEPDRKSVV